MFGGIEAPILTDIAGTYIHILRRLFSRRLELMREKLPAIRWLSVYPRVGALEGLFAGCFFFNFWLVETTRCLPDIVAIL